MIVVENMDNGHKLVGRSLKGGLVELKSVGPNGDEAVIGTYYPPEQVDYREEILNDGELTDKAANILMKFARRWE